MPARISKRRSQERQQHARPRSRRGQGHFGHIKAVGHLGSRPNPKPAPPFAAATGGRAHLERSCLPVRSLAASTSRHALSLNRWEELQDRLQGIQVIHLQILLVLVTCDYLLMHALLPFFFQFGNLRLLQSIWSLSLS
jgi:hypothetical protein